MSRPARSAATSPSVAASPAKSRWKPCPAICGWTARASVSGDLTLAVPRDLSAQVTGESFSGDLSAPGAKIEREEFGPGSSFHTRYGAGKGDVRIETFSGD